jgi:hypothetical protein
VAIPDGPNARLREPSVVAAARRLFPSLVGLAMRQHPDTVVAGFMYEPSALLTSFLLAQHPHRFSYEAIRRMMRESAEEQEAQIALMDAGSALAETFEALLRAFLLLRSTTTTKTTSQTRMRRMRMMLQEEEPTTTTTTAKLLLPQLRAYQGALAAWTAVTPPMHVLLAQLSSILEDLLRTREPRRAPPV